MDDKQIDSVAEGGAKLIQWIARGAQIGRFSPGCLQKYVANTKYDSGGNTALLAHHSWLFSVIIVELMHKNQGYSQSFCSIMQEPPHYLHLKHKGLFQPSSWPSALPSAQLTQLTSLSILTVLSLAQQ